MSGGGAEVLHHGADGLVDGTRAKVFDRRTLLHRFDWPAHRAVLGPFERLGGLNSGATEHAVHPFLGVVTLDNDIMLRVQEWERCQPYKMHSK